MKNLIRLLALQGVLYSSMTAQFSKGEMEISLLGSAANGQFDQVGLAGQASTEPRAVWFLASSFDCYVGNGLALGPEVGYLKVEHEQSALYGLGNISYTAYLPAVRVAPFVVAGYGFGSSTLLNTLDDPVKKASTHFNVWIANLGIGAKFVIGDHVLLKAMFNHRSYREPELFGRNRLSNTGFVGSLSILL